MRPGHQQVRVLAKSRHASHLHPAMHQIPPCIPSGNPCAGPCMRPCFETAWKTPQSITCASYKSSILIWCFLFQMWTALYNWRWKSILEDKEGVEMLYCFFYIEFLISFQFLYQFFFLLSDNSNNCRWLIFNFGILYMIFQRGVNVKNLIKTKPHEIASYLYCNRLCLIKR